MMRIGVHCSIYKSLLTALEEAEKLHCQTIQLFTRSPRGWYRRKLLQKEIYLFRQRVIELNLYPVILHMPYLPNPATSDTLLYRKSLSTLIEDLSRAVELGGHYLVFHPGAYSFCATPEYGLLRIAELINTVLAKINTDIVLLLENVSGGGRRLGASFNEIKFIIDHITDKKYIGVCFDTCHALSAGYELSTAEGVNRTFKEFSAVVGWKYIKVLHLNDSYYPLGSKKDRHQHIGKGYIGLEGFKAILFYPGVENLPCILETPKSSLAADKRNLRIIFDLLN